MKEIRKEIKKGITVHVIETDQFKTNLLSIFLTTPLTRENVTSNALIPAVLMQGSENIKTAEKISKELEKMYGASFDGGVEKAGDNQVLKFYLESLNDEFVPEKSELIEKSINLLWEIVFHPLTENNSFKDEYVKVEKEKLQQRIEGKIDNKASFALIRCIEEMYKNKPFGLYKYGYIEDLNNINSRNLYERYLNLIQNSKIDIFISGKLSENMIKNIEKKVEELNEREPKFILTDSKRKIENLNPKLIKEKMEISQAKLVMGLDVNVENQEEKYVALVYNGILGGIPTSKLFQNVRERESLAYTASSSYLRQKDNIFIKCGIEAKNFEKAKEIIEKQLEDMKNGEFTQEDIKSAKRNIISAIKCIPDEQDMGITYYFGQELSLIKMNFDNYVEKIENVTKDEIQNLAQRVFVNTIYLLEGGKEA